MRLPVLIEQGEDGFWVASCPALPGCHSQGCTEEEAQRNIREAIEGYLESVAMEAAEHGEGRLIEVTL